MEGERERGRKEKGEKGKKGEREREERRERKGEKGLNLCSDPAKQLLGIGFSWPNSLLPFLPTGQAKGEQSLVFFVFNLVACVCVWGEVCLCACSSVSSHKHTMVLALSLAISHL